MGVAQDSRPSARMAWRKKKKKKEKEGWPFDFLLQKTEWRDALFKCQPPLVRCAEEKS